MASGSLFSFQVDPPGQTRNICLARKEKMFLDVAFPGGKKRDIVPAGCCVVWSRKHVPPPPRGPLRTSQSAAAPVTGHVGQAGHSGWAAAQDVCAVEEETRLAEDRGSDKPILQARAREDLAGSLEKPGRGTSLCYVKT